MIFSKPSPQPTSGAIERQALAWMGRVAAGRMTHADGVALRRWCQADPAHQAALAAARRRWELLRAAGEVSAARAPVAATRAVLPRRRLLLGGALGFTAAAAAAAAVHPPLGLWPSIDELRADHRTGPGERRSVALDPDVDIELNTRTSIILRGGGASSDGLDAGALGVELIAGEAAVDMRGTRRGIAVEAGRGRIAAKGARFALRRDADRVCVSCLEGRLELTHAGGSTVLETQQQLRYDDQARGPVTRLGGADLARLSAWREGFLRFVDTPLGEVVDEINRYRAGQVVLLNRQLAARQVTARFQIDALDRAIAQMQHSLGLGVRSLPGGVVLLS